MILSTIISSIACFIIGICIGIVILFCNYIHTNNVNYDNKLKNKKEKNYIDKVKEYITDKYGPSTIWFKFDGITFWMYDNDPNRFFNHDEESCKKTTIDGFNKHYKENYPNITNYYCIFSKVYASDGSDTLNWHIYPVEIDIKPDPDLIAAYDQLLEKK